MEKNLGHATAYGYAKSKGYSGTEEEFAQLMADYASVGQSAAQSAEQAAASATSASGSAATATQAAQTATSKASEAVTAADTATTKASEASTSANTASTAAQTATDKASEATTAAITATAKASEASESAATASTAKTDAETARDAAAQSASEAAESARTLTIDATLTQSGQAADAKVVGDKIEGVKNDLDDVKNILYIDPPYKLDAANFEYGGIAVTVNGGYSYLNSGRMVRTKENYYVSLNAGDTLSIGDGSVTLTLVSDGTTVEKTIELYVGYYNPTTNKYVARQAETSDFTAPIDGDYVLVIRLTDYTTHYLTIYTDAVEKMSGRIEVVPKNSGNLRTKLDESLRYLIKNPNCMFVAHQGYSADMAHNNCRLQGYVDAFYRGFDWAEVDIKQTSDGYVVCCHDNTFVDATSGETITIASSTLVQLQTHNYYGTKIATLDDVVYTCKMFGLGLYIDQLSSAEIIHKAFAVVRHHGMLDRVAWSIPYGYQAVHTVVMDEYDKAIVTTTSATSTISEIITFAESIATNGNLVYAYLPYTGVTASELQTISEQLPNNIRLGIWAPNTIGLIKPLLPYVEAVTSDKISYFDIFGTIG